MAGFFGLFDYNKEGPGVYEDEPPKAPFFVFFDVVGRKFWKLCTINLMYLLFSIPALAIAFLSAMFLTQMIVPTLTVDTFVNQLTNAGIQLRDGVTIESYAYSQLTFIFLVVGCLLMSLGQIVIGPVQAGVTYVLRNYAREEHSFVWLDFKEHARKNLRQSAITSLISLAVTFIFAVNVAFYGNTRLFTNGNIRTVVQTIIVILYAIWLAMHMYLYPMMVTFDLKLKELYRNCFLFSILRLPYNILFLVLNIILMGLLPAILLFIGYGWAMILGLIFYLGIGFAFSQLMTIFFAYQGLDRFMIKRLDQQQAAAEADREVESGSLTGEADDTASGGEPSSDLSASDNDSADS